MILLLNKYNKYLQTRIFNFDLLLSLRGLMAISVVLYHFFIRVETIKTNFVKYFIFALDGAGAVLVFFILSGYLMFKLFATNRYSLVNLGDFYKARINRVLPLYWGVLILVNIFIYGNFWLPGGPVDFLKMFSFTQYLNGEDFVLEKYKWFSVTWSLVIEMQFYLVVPFLAWALLKFKDIKIQLLLLLFFTYCAIQSKFLNFGVSHHLNILFGRSILGYLPYFCVGGMVALILAFSNKTKNILSNLTFLLPLLLIILIIGPAYSRIYIPEFNRYLITIPFTVLIIGIFDAFNWDKKPATWNYSFLDILNPKKILEMFGHLSFSIYMWHLFIILQFGTFIRAENFPNLSSSKFILLQKCLELIGILAFSLFSYFTIEKLTIINKSKKINLDNSFK